MVQLCKDYATEPHLGYIIPTHSLHMAFGNTIEAVACFPHPGRVNVASIALPKLKRREHGGFIQRNGISVFPNTAT